MQNKNSIEITRLDLPKFVFLFVKKIIFQRKMARSTVSESKREEFRKYLEKEGIVELVTQLLVRSYTVLFSYIREKRLEKNDHAGFAL